MGFFNRFLADEMATMRRLLWRLSDPRCGRSGDEVVDMPGKKIAPSDHVGSVGGGTPADTAHTARLVDMFVVRAHHLSRPGNKSNVNKTNSLAFPEIGGAFVSHLKYLKKTIFT